MTPRSGGRAVRALFLDIDGVLNSAEAFGRLHENHALREEIGNYLIEPEPMRLLRQIVALTGAEVVLSSSWRHNLPGEGHRMLAFAALYSHGIRVAGCTPSLDFGPRGDEIAAWLAQHPEVETYCILDDNSDMREEQEPHFVKTAWSQGLTEADADRAVEILNAVRVEEEAP